MCDLVGWGGYVNSILDEYAQFHCLKRDTGIQGLTVGLVHSTYLAHETVAPETVYSWYLDI